MRLSTLRKTILAGAPREPGKRGGTFDPAKSPATDAMEKIIRCIDSGVPASPKKLANALGMVESTVGSYMVSIRRALRNEYAKPGEMAAVRMGESVDPGGRRGARTRTLQGVACGEEAWRRVEASR